ncbi:MAG TPA: histidine kinase dimerization/phospho-acceptor domain-containing protein [Stellaceae bacterium]|nr:histidine kinase dimerization/phospho-acceptor domain-containing protein [Stellaceae bacterium]
MTAKTPPEIDAVFLQEIIDSLDMSVVVHDADLCFVIANAEYYKRYPHIPSDGSWQGLPYEQLLRTTLAASPEKTAIAPTEDPEAYVARRIVEMRDFEPGRFEYQAEDGRCDVLQRTRTSSGYRVSTRYDVTEQKQLEHQLRQALEEVAAANRAKSSFLASMSHELRTPLNGILGYAEILRDAQFGGQIDARYRQAAGDILNAGQHLLSLISDLLDLARIETGKAELQEEDVSLPDLINTVLRLMIPKAFASLNQLTFLAPETPPVLRVDPRMVRQMLFNLIGNALAHAPGTEITLSLEDADDGALDLVIRDRGPGLPQAIKAHLGEPFLAGSRGTGLGLALVSGMIADHGGGLRFDDVPGDVGTRAILRFPRSRRTGVTE